VGGGVWVGVGVSVGVRVGVGVDEGVQVMVGVGVGVKVGLGVRVGVGVTRAWRSGEQSDSSTTAIPHTIATATRTKSRIFMRMPWLHLKRPSGAAKSQERLFVEKCCHAWQRPTL
jgi:hypothetical protein